MKRASILFIVLLFIVPTVTAQLVEKQSNGYTYKTDESDPVKARIYTLKNGLTVYLSVNKDAPRIQTFVAVKAGSKYDPADATGLAHYLEHLMFKGTTKFGTSDYEKEKPYLENIVKLYEDYRAEKDETKRKEIYRTIDSISQISSGFAIANEYDKMMAVIGAKGTNAWTSFEQTVYMNEIPSNQLERWLYIESDRFFNAIFRIFHTELEVVYEEKNISLDNGDSKAWEAFYKGLFPNHQYGTQTVIGTAEHLKNPSLQKVIDYYKKYYVPSNMAICLSGDMNPDETISLIDKYWGNVPEGKVNDYLQPKSDTKIKSITTEVFSPESESVYLGYRYAGSGTREADMMSMISMILYNQYAGLVDINLNQSQKVLNCWAYTMSLKDYGALIFNAQPREGQSLEEVRKLILDQIDLIKKGEFPDWLPAAIVNDIKLQTIKAMDNNINRAGEFVNAFTLGIPWDKYIESIDRISKFTKKDLVDFAKNFFGDNCVTVYKRTGEDKNVIKVVKPEITPVQLNRTAQSEFSANITKIPVSKIEPVFLDFKTDFSTIKLNYNIPLYYKKNENNKLFSLDFYFDAGKNNDRMLELAADYFTYLGTSKYSPVQIKQEFYKIGCTYSAYSSDDETYLTLTGLDENFESALNLFEELLNDVQPNPEAYSNMVSDILKVRENNKLDKYYILWDAMFDYGTYGKISPYKNIYSENELKNIKPEALTDYLRKLKSYSHEVIYFGSKDEAEMTKILNEKHIVKEQNPLPNKSVFNKPDNDENVIYVVNYKDMKQAEIVMLSKGGIYDKSLSPRTKLYNEYFGGGMSGIVFQELRESKALAYSVYSVYRAPREKNDNYMIFSYIGTQSDKIEEALNGFTELLNNMPKSEVTFESAKNGVLEVIQTERIIKSDVIFRYLTLRKLGIDYDIRKDVYEQVQGMTFDDIKLFHEKYIKGKKQTILILGDREKLNISILEKFGKVKYLELDEIFGY